MAVARHTLLGRCVHETGVLRKAESAALVGALPWNRFGLRDPTLLMSPDGRPIADELGHFALFFNARDRAVNDGGMTCVGRAVGSPESGWTIDAEPAFSDGRYAAQGSAIQLAPDHCRLYYSADTSLGLSMASSCDGKSWKKFGQGLILTPKPFGVRRMGLPYVRRVFDRWVMVFEGMDKGAFHIYLALSSDGITWQPGNDGKPIYWPTADAWDCHGQANPSLYIESDDEGRTSLYLLYNGCRAESDWDLGILSANTLEGPWLAGASPMLRRGQAGEWDAGRLEGARLFQPSERSPMLMYFGLPTGDSYLGGGIAFAAIAPASECAAGARVDANANSAAERTFNNGLARRYFDVWDNYPIQRFTTAVESRLMHDVIPQRSNVLVLGSGGGREIPALLDLNCSITAVDISPQMLAAGRKRYPEADIRWIEADLHSLPAHLAGFDAAICLGAVFNYLRDPGLFLSNSRRCLRDGGTLVLSVINAQHASEPKAEALLADGRVRQLYSLSDLRTLLSRAGFSITSTTGVRFLVDLLPAEWNRHASSTSDRSHLLDALLELEAKLSDCLPTERAKFMLIHAVAGRHYPVISQIVSTARAARRVWSDARR